MNFRSILHFVLGVFLEYEPGNDLFNTVMSVVLVILLYAGLFGIFRKCGLKGWHAFIPCLREIELGRAADREKEGRVLAVTRGLIILLDLAALVFPIDDPARAGRAFSLISVMQIVIGLIGAIYRIRVYLGLIETFGLKKLWIILWIICGTIPAVLWGWVKKYQPLWTVQETDDEAAGYFSNTRAAVLDQGLTVNLEERTATEFFKKKYLLRDIHMYI